jgi:hypothetical protein
MLVDPVLTGKDDEEGGHDDGNQVGVERSGINLDQVIGVPFSHIELVILKNGIQLELVHGNMIRATIVPSPQL